MLTWDLTETNICASLGVGERFAIVHLLLKKIVTSDVASAVDYLLSFYGGCQEEHAF